ncbi:MAG TPA: hypothetical protein VN276_04220 [Bacteroidales bacterium]|nr:hypothetical protein [Bacteroidales bacterium]
MKIFRSSRALHRMGWISSGWSLTRGLPGNSRPEGKIIRDYSLRS